VGNLRRFLGNIGGDLIEFEVFFGGFLNSVLCGLFLSTLNEGLRDLTCF
jgi:hypothetical protein